MQHQEFAPPEALGDVIKCFWYNTRDSGPEQTTFEVMPDGYTEIIFHFGNACSVMQDGVPRPLPSPFMMGLLNQPATFYTQNRLQVMAIRCYPWTVFDLLGLPAGKQGVHTFEHPIAQLQPSLERCVREDNIAQALEILTAYLLGAISKLATDSMLFKAGKAMRKAHGTLPVSEVAAAAHATVRTLERNFKQSSGHTIKDVSGLMRFEQVRNRLWWQPGTNLAGLAAELGYADQAHLSKEFKRYSGSSPAAFARNAKKEHALLHSDFVAFIQS